jgi:DNA-binding response OmpR family regulator
MHALIIEDEDLIAIAIEEILRGCGFTSFHVAVSFDEAVAAARERCPRLITADVELKPGSGIDAVQTICSDNPIPVIFITGRADATRSRMPQHPVLRKPFRMSEVQAAVREVMRQ